MLLDKAGSVIKY